MDDPFLSISEISEEPANSKKELPCASSGTQNIIERKMFNITTFRIYPNGDMFIVKSQSWFDKSSQIIKKKEKKMATPTKVELNEEEVY